MLVKASIVCAFSLLVGSANRNSCEYLSEGWSENAGPGDLNSLMQSRVLTRDYGDDVSLENSSPSKNSLALDPPDSSRSKSRSPTGPLSVAEQTAASSCAMASSLQKLLHNASAEKVLSQQCPGPFGISKTEGKRRLAIMVRGESFRGLSGMYNRHIDVNNMTFDCQRAASMSHVKHIIEPFEACGFKVDVFLKTWKAHDKKWRQNSSRQLIDMYGGRVVQAAFDHHAMFEKVGVVKTRRTPQATNFETGLHMIANYSQTTGVTWDALLIIRSDLIFKRPLGHVKYERVMLAFHEWSFQPGEMVADTIHYFPWKFLNCAVQDGFREHYSLAIANRVGVENFDFLIKDLHDANTMADWNPLYKMCRPEQKYNIDGGFALLMFSVDPPATTWELETSGTSVRTSLAVQGEPRALPAVDIVYHAWVHDISMWGNMIDVLKNAFGKVPADYKVQFFKPPNISTSGWESAGHSISSTYSLLTHSVSFKERIQTFQFDRYVYARVGYHFIKPFISAYACQTDQVVCVGYGAKKWSTVPVVIIASVKASLNFQSQWMSLIHLVQGREPNATLYLEKAFGLPVKVLCQRC